MIDLSRSSPLITITSLMIAYAGPFLLFFLYLYNKPQLVALFLVSSLSSLFGLILTAIIWRATVNTIDVRYFSLLGTLIQECSRFYLIHSIYRKVETTYIKSFTSITNMSSKRKDLFILDDLSSSIASGLGFGLMKSLLIFGNIITKHINSSTNSKYLNMFDKTPNISNILGLAIITMLFCFLDLTIMPIAFFAEKNSKKKIIVFVFVLRFLSTTMMFFNNIENGFYYSMGGLILIILISLFLLIKIYPELTEKMFFQKIEDTSIVAAR